MRTFFLRKYFDFENKLTTLHPFPFFFFLKDYVSSISGFDIAYNVLPADIFIKFFVVAPTVGYDLDPAIFSQG